MSMALAGAGLVQTASAPSPPPSIAPNEILVGVSVTRAMKFRGGPSAFNEEDATVLLTKKLRGMIGARDGVTSTQAWHRQILHVWAESPHVADVLHRTLNDPTRISPRLWRDTIVVCTVAPVDTMHRIVFKNDRFDYAALLVPEIDPHRHAAQIARLRRMQVLQWAALDGSLISTKRSQ